MNSCGFPYRLVGAVSFYERREVKDVLAYLRLVHNSFDAVSLQRVINLPPRGIGTKTVQELLRWSTEQGLGPYDALVRATECRDCEFDVLARTRARVGAALRDQLIQRLLVKAATRRLPQRLFIGHESAVVQLPQDRLGRAGHAARSVDVLDSNDPSPSMRACIEPARQRRDERARVQRPSR